MKVEVNKNFKWRLKTGNIATFVKGDIIKIDYYLGLSKQALGEMCIFDYAKKVIEPIKKSERNEKKENEEKGEKEEKKDFENKMVNLDYKKKPLPIKQKAKWKGEIRSKKNIKIGGK